MLRRTAEYTIQEVPATPSNTIEPILRLNNYAVATGDNFTGVTTGWYWRPGDGAVTTIPAIIPNVSAQSRDINDDDLIIGTGGYIENNTVRTVFFYDPATGVTTDIGHVSGLATIGVQKNAMGINNAATPQAAVSLITDSGGFTGRPGAIIDINRAAPATSTATTFPSPFESFSFPLAINDSGASTGVDDSGFDNNGDPIEGFVREADGSFRRLGFLPGSTWYLSQGNDINNSNVVTGYSHQTGTERHAIRWDRNATTGEYDATDLHAATAAAFPTHTLYSTAGAAINELNQIVGYRRTTQAGAPSFATLWDPTEGPVDLMSQVVGPNPFSEMTAASDINEWGQIVGSGRRASDAQFSSWLLTPYGLGQVPEAPDGVTVAVTVADSIDGIPLISEFTFGEVSKRSPIQIEQDVVTQAEFESIYAAGAPVDAFGDSILLWQIDVQELEFSGQVEVTFSYDSQLIGSGLAGPDDEANLVILRYVEATESWEPLTTLRRDLDADTITVSTPGFSTFALGIPEPASLSLLGISGLVVLRRRRIARGHPQV